MMREIVLDTETTGIQPSNGHRLIETGAVEIVNSAAKAVAGEISKAKPTRRLDAGDGRLGR
jgi:DNA polymerase-3 subunit epsilon